MVAKNTSEKKTGIPPLTSVASPAALGETAPAAAAKKTRKTKTKVERINGRLLRGRDLVLDVRAMLVASLRGVDPKGPMALALQTAEQKFGAARATIEEASVALLDLQKAKWEPPKKGGKVALFAGDAVSVRAGGHKRFIDAYSAEDLQHLRVVSVHGKLVKVEIYKDGLRGECLGLVPGRILRPTA